jgi:hypothetical protein
MSAETDFRALLAGHAGTAALVSTRIAQSAVTQDSVVPLIVFTTSHEREFGLDGTLLSQPVSISVQCWGETPAQAESVATQVKAACATAPIARGCTVTSEASGFDPELALDAVELTVEWWAT